MAYTHNSGYSATRHGYAVGEKGHEIPVIDQSGELLLGGEPLSTYLEEALGDLEERIEAHNTVKEECTAGGTIRTQRLVKSSGQGVLAEADEDTENVVGVNTTDTVETLGKFDLGIGFQEVKIIGPTDAGVPLKVYRAGLAGRFVDATLAGSTIKDGITGGNFANQPANDSITVVSSSDDDTMLAMVYGTTHGGDGTVVGEQITLTGTTPKVTTKTDWGLCLGVLLLGTAAVGTVTIKETSGGLTIATIAPAGTNAGVHVISLSNEQRAYNTRPVVAASGASTKYVSMIGVDKTGAAKNMAATQLAGSSDVTCATFMETITTILVGDLESARTLTVKVGAADNITKKIGRSITVGGYAETAISAVITP
jgi:hypothetical protein